MLQLRSAHRLLSCLASYNRDENQAGEGQLKTHDKITQHIN